MADNEEYSDGVAEGEDFSDDGEDFSGDEASSDNGADDADEFEYQGSSSGESDGEDDNLEREEDENLKRALSVQKRRELEIQRGRADGSLAKAEALHIDDMSDDDDETPRNTIGNVPLKWYEEYDHLGYDLQGKKWMKQSALGEGKDRIDDAVDQEDDVDYMRTIYDAVNDRDVVLSDRDLEILRRIQSGAFAHPEFEAYPDYIPFNTHKGVREKHSLHQGTEPKRRFVPSKWERMKVLKMVKDIQEGRLQTTAQKKRSIHAHKKELKMLWKDDDVNEKKKNAALHVPAPKMALPGHAESYNPPDEYIPDEDEIKQWEEMDPSDRPYDFIPKKHNSLREVGAFPDFIKQRFERCLDLYLCPRAMKRKLNIDPESLVPVLPKPRELRPFPTTQAVLYKIPNTKIRAVSFSPDGQYFASGSDDHIVRIWEVDTGRCRRQWNVGGVVQHLEWNPSRDMHVVAVAVKQRVFLLSTANISGGDDDIQITNAFLGAAPTSTNAQLQNLAVEAEAIEKELSAKPPPEVEDDDDDDDAEVEKKKHASWHRLEAGTEAGSSVRVIIQHRFTVAKVSWHKKGDYLISLSQSNSAGAAAVLIHQVSKASTQRPMGKNHGQIQAALFHPSKPILFMATKVHVRVYHLVKQGLIKKLLPGCKWISSMTLHPSGDHLLLGTYDRRVIWFDLDLSSMPYKTLKYHGRAVRQVAYHPRYPLMASASDDGCIHIIHSMVYSDLLKNPLIVPLKVIHAHKVSDSLGVLSLAYHPTQPWILSSAADGTIRLFQDIH